MYCIALKVLSLHFLLSRGLILKLIYLIQYHLKNLGSTWIYIWDNVRNLSCGSRHCIDSSSIKDGQENYSLNYQLQYGLFRTPMRYLFSLPWRIIDIGSSAHWKWCCASYIKNICLKQFPQSARKQFTLIDLDFSLKTSFI